MARRTLSGALRRRKQLNMTVGILGVALLILGVAFVFNRPKKIEASVLVTGDYAAIDGGSSSQSYVIDTDGYVYQKPSLGLTDDNNLALDYRYYSYLSTPVLCGSEVCNVAGKTLSLKNTTVLMEGDLNLKNLLVENTASVSQPYADRAGMINRPIYAGDYWGMRMTGFLKVPRNSIYYLSAEDIDDAVKIESFSGNTISLDGSNNWSAIYVAATAGSLDAWNSGAALNTTAGDFSSSGSYKLLQNTSSADLWVPIRFSFADSTGTSQFKLKYNLYSGSDTGLTASTSAGYLSMNDLSGIGNSGEPLGSDGWGYLDFEYFIAKNGTSLPNSTFTNAAKTFEVSNMKISTALASPYGFIGSSDQTFKLAFDQDSQVASPLGDSDAAFHRTIASRYTNLALNPNMFAADVSAWPNMFVNSQGTVRRIAAGLTLNIENELRIDGERGINLNGVGYPGWGNEFKSSGYDQQRGGGTGGGESADTLGAGASYARNGGAASGSSWGTGKATYGDASEIIGKTYLGSGGGSSKTNIGGSGGGTIKIAASLVNLKYKNAIEANGNGGIIVSTPKNVSGGSGGKVVIKTSDFIIDGFADTGGTKNAVISAKGFGFEAGAAVENVSGGSGGYIVLVYDTSTDADINIGNYSTRLSVGGGAGVEGVSAADADGVAKTEWTGQAGVISVVKKSDLQSATIKKWLLPIDRPNETGISNSNFNPYSIQLNDMIQVNLEVSNLSAGLETVIEDEILEVYGGTEKCVPVTDTIVDPSDSTITDSGYDNASGEVYWKFIPSTNGSLTMSYNCKVTN